MTLRTESHEPDLAHVCVCVRVCVCVPLQVFDELTTRYVLVSKWIDGRRLSSLDKNSEVRMCGAHCVHVCVGYHA